MKYDKKNYYLIFDTNTLYHGYDRASDFTSFTFNGTYENIIGMINQLDIYDKVTIVIPNVVWREMEEQIIEAHSEKLKTVKSQLSKYIFPELEIIEKQIGYNEYINEKIGQYRTGLSTDINHVIEMPIAGPNRYDSIVERAFKKLPPFEGKSKKSDKGFKDALLWESILDFAGNHPGAKMIYYSKDNIFEEYLTSEFTQIFPNEELSLCKNEPEVLHKLEDWAKEIDIYAYQPIEEYSENAELISWINSGDFIIQIIDHDFGVAENSRLIRDTTFKLLSYDNIQHFEGKDGANQYEFEAELEISYTMEGGTVIGEKAKVAVDVDFLCEELFVVENIYRIDEEEN